MDEVINVWVYFIFCECKLQFEYSACDDTYRRSNAKDTQKLRRLLMALYCVMAVKQL